MPIRWPWCLVAVAGCSWRAGYEESSLSCAAPSSTCPVGYRCSADGLCLRPGDGDPDARPGADGAGVSDGSIGIQAVTVSFGERPTSDVTGVTFDTYLSSGNPSDNKGAKDAFYSTSAGDESRHALVRFDLTSISPGAVVVDASLELWTTDFASGGAVQAFPMLESWDEGNQDDASGFANWSFRKPRQSWSGEGATPPSRATQPVVEVEPPAEQTPFAMALPADLVQGWVGSPPANLGITIVAVTPGGDHGFSSSESLLSRRRPQLTVTFVP